MWIKIKLPKHKSFIYHIKVDYLSLLFLWMMTELLSFQIFITIASISWLSFSKTDGFLFQLDFFGFFAGFSFPHKCQDLVYPNHAMTPKNTC